MLSKAIRVRPNSASEGRSMKYSQQPDLSDFYELLEQWHSHVRQLQITRDFQNTMTAQVILECSDELEAAIKKASGSAANTSEAGG